MWWFSASCRAVLLRACLLEPNSLIALDEFLERLELDRLAQIAVGVKAELWLMSISASDV